MSGGSWCLLTTGLWTPPTGTDCTARLQGTAAGDRTGQARQRPPQPMAPKPTAHGGHPGKYLVDVVEVGALVWPVVVTLPDAVLREGGQHDDDHTAALPHHLQTDRDRREWLSPMTCVVSALETQSESVPCTGDSFHFH